MISMKKIVGLLIALQSILQPLNLKAMDYEKQRKQENREIRKLLRSMQFTAIKLVEETRKTKGSAECTKSGETLTSMDGKRENVIIHLKNKTCTRKYDDFIQIFQEISSDDEDEQEDMLEHTNRDDGSLNDHEQLLQTSPESKKCCCLLY